MSQFVDLSRETDLTADERAALAAVCLETPYRPALDRALILLSAAQEAVHALINGLESIPEADRDEDERYLLMDAIGVNFTTEMAISVLDGKLFGFNDSDSATSLARVLMAADALTRKTARRVVGPKADLGPDGEEDEAEAEAEADTDTDTDAEPAPSIILTPRWPQQ